MIVRSASIPHGRGLRYTIFSVGSDLATGEVELTKLIETRVSELQMIFMSIIATSAIVLYALMASLSAWMSSPVIPMITSAVVALGVLVKPLKGIADQITAWDIVIDKRRKKALGAIHLQPIYTWK